MKQSIRASLSSAFILPGLGQVLNRQIGKGLTMMAAITVILIVLLLKVVFAFTDILRTVPMEPGEKIFSAFFKGLQSGGYTLVLTLAILGVALWVYSIVDAFYHGMRYQPKEDED